MSAPAPIAGDADALSAVTIDVDRRRTNDEAETTALLERSFLYKKGYEAVDDTGRPIEHDFRNTVLDCRQDFGCYIMTFELADFIRTAYYMYNKFMGSGGGTIYSEDNPFRTLLHLEAALGFIHVVSFNLSVWYCLQLPGVFSVLNFVEAVILVLAFGIMFLMLSGMMAWSTFDFVFQIVALGFTLPNAYFAYLVSSGNLPLENRVFIL